MKLYTAIGKYEFRRNTTGEKLPHIIAFNRDHEPDVWEMLTGVSGAGAVCSGTSSPIRKSVTNSTKRNG